MSLAAALASAAVIAGMAGQAPPLGAPPPQPTLERTPNLYSQPAHCKSVVQREVARQMTAFKSYPPAAQYAVVRKLEGCDVPTPVGYHPSAPPPAKAAP